VSFRPSLGEFDLELFTIFTICFIEMVSLDFGRVVYNMKKRKTWMKTTKQLQEVPNVINSKLMGGLFA